MEPITAVTGSSQQYSRPAKTEARALRPFLLGGVGLGYSRFLSDVPGGDQSSVDVPTHPDDIEIPEADAAGPVQTAEAKSGFAGEAYWGLGLNFWQFASLTYRRSTESEHCNMRQYQDGYSAYTAVCFSRRPSQSLSLGVYPLVIPYEDAKYEAVLFGLEAGIVESKFTFKPGWHRWGSFELSSEMSQTDTKRGFVLGVTGEALFHRAFSNGAHWGLRADIFPGAYYNIMLNLGISVGFLVFKTGQ